jgi:hypothetical protein
LDDHGHCRQHANASFKTQRAFFAFGREAELAIVTEGVAIFAAMGVKHVAREFLRTIVGVNHAI